MAVLKQTSPTAVPVAPRPKPSSTVPSASTKSAVGLGSTQVPVGAAFVWVMGTYLRIITTEARGRFGPPPARMRANHGYGKNAYFYLCRGRSGGGMFLRGRAGTADAAASTISGQSRHVDLAHRAGLRGQGCRQGRRPHC